jgi:hypothetical protein
MSTRALPVVYARVEVHARKGCVRPPAVGATEVRLVDERAGQPVVASGRGWQRGHAIVTDRQRHRCRGNLVKAPPGSAAGFSGYVAV